MAPRRLYLEREGSPEGPDYEFVLYTDYSDLFGGPVLFEEAALRVGTRAQLEGALHWRFLPQPPRTLAFRDQTGLSSGRLNLLDLLARMEPEERYVLFLARKGGRPGKRGSAGVAVWPAAEAGEKGILERLKAELREAARDAEPADPEELPYAFIVQTFEYEPGIG